jgi:hypothetical protein
MPCRVKVNGILFLLDQKIRYLVALTGLMGIFFLSACKETKLGQNFYSGVHIGYSVSSLSVSESQVASGNTVKVTLALKDTNGKPFISTHPRVSFSASGGGSTGTFGAVTNAGDGSYWTLFTGATPGTATTIHATVDDSEILSSLPTITVTSGAPVIRLVGSPATNIVAARALSLELVTGTAMANCAWFVDLALTEDDATAPVDNGAYTITCTQSGTQALNYTLLGAGDGVKTLRLWARDSNGVISAIASSIAIILDTTPPSAPVLTTASADNNASSFAVAGTCDSDTTQVQLKLNGTTQSTVACTSLAFSGSITSSTDAAHSVTARAIDFAGNLSVSNSAAITWTRDTAAPSAPVVALASSNPTNSTAATLTIASCADRAAIYVSATSTAPTAAAAGWQTCYTTAAAITATLSTGDGTQTLYVFAKDSVGNVSTSNTLAVVLDQTAPLIAVTTPGSTQGNGNYGTVNFSVTDSAIATASTALVEIYNGSAWSSVGTVALTAGVNAAQSYSLSNFSVPAVAVTTARVRVTVADAAGNSTTQQSGTFTIDSVAPVLASFNIVGSSTIITPILTLQVNATDTLPGVASVKFAEADAGNCQTSYANIGWQTFVSGGGPQIYSYTSSFSPGTKRLCAWAKDALGNVSQVTASAGAGTNGVDAFDYNLVLDAPPRITSISVTNNNGASANFGTTTFTSGDSMSIAFTVTSSAGLATNPVAIYYSTDGTSYTTLLASAPSVGSTVGSPVSWTQTYTGASAPSSGFFRLMFVMRDVNGGTATTLSPTLNTGRWSIYAGTDYAGNGASALSARISLTSYRNVAVTSDGTIYIMDYGANCLRKVDPGTGIISSYICSNNGLGVGIPASGTATITSATRLPYSGNGIFISMWADGAQLYIVQPSSISATQGAAIYRIDTALNTIERYAAGVAQASGIVGATTNVDSMYIGPQMINSTFDFNSKAIYLFQPCSGTNANISYSEQLTLVRVTQNPTTRAASAVEHVAGNCAAPRGTVTNGTDATSIPIANGNGSSAGDYYLGCCSWPHVDSPTGAIYYHLNNRVVKIASNNKAYNIPGVPSLLSSISNPSDGRLYHMTAGGGISYFIPTAAPTTAESSTAYIVPYSSATVATCANDGIAVASACSYAGSLFLTSDSRLAYTDGNNGNSFGIAWLRMVDGSGIIRTLAGTRYLSGVGNDAKTAQFNMVQTLLWKATSTAAPTSLSSGLYIADSGALAITRVNTGTGLLELVGGNQISKAPTNGATFGSQFIGSAAASFSVGTLAFDQNGLLVWQSGSSLSRLTSSNTISVMFSGGTDLANASDGATFATLATRDNGGGSGMVIDSSGQIYYGGYRNLSGQYASYPRIGYLDPSTNRYYRVIGADSPPAITTNSSGDAVSADGAVYSAGSYKTIGCAPNPTNGHLQKGAYSCYMQLDQRYNSGEGRLIFAEQNKLRTITRPWDYSTSVLGTLLDATRPVGAFAIQYVDGSSSTIDRVYYISGGVLYCYRVTGGNTAGCSNASLGPPAGMPGLNSTTLTQDTVNNLYGVSSNRQVIYQFVPPN